MGAWAWAVLAIATIAGIFFTVMAFRGLIEAVDHFAGRCVVCRKVTVLPLPTQSHRCWRCHYRDALVAHPVLARLQPRH